MRTPCTLLLALAVAGCGSAPTEPEAAAVTPRADIPPRPEIDFDYPIVDDPRM